MVDLYKSKSNSELRNFKKKFCFVNRTTHTHGTNPIQESRGIDHVVAAASFDTCE